MPEAIRKAVADANLKRDLESSARDTSAADDANGKDDGEVADGSEADDEDKDAIPETQLDRSRAVSASQRPPSTSPRTASTAGSTSGVSSSADGMPSSQVRLCRICFSVCDTATI